MNDTAMSEHLSIYPNPYAEGMLSISVSNVRIDQSASISFFDISGNLVRSNSVFLSEGNNVLRIESPEKLAPGSYLVQLNLDNSIRVSKVVIQ